MFENDGYLEPIDFDKKHKVSKKALETLEKVMFSQDEYGVKKYGKPLTHTQHYNWMQMFMEEMADGLKYIQNEMDMKALVINILEWGIENDPKHAIESALRMLKVEGTGK